jgi:hypothetical protein
MLQIIWKSHGNGRILWHDLSIRKCMWDLERGTFGVYMAGLLKTAARELGKCKLDSVGVQEVRWEKGGTERTHDYRPTCFYGEGNEGH